MWDSVAGPLRRVRHAVRSGAYIHLVTSPEWPITSGLSDRFWAKVEVAGDDDCWLWRAHLNYRGYGVIRNGKRIASATRISWALTNGCVPDGKHVLHHCDVRACVNPRHLYVGTNTDNVADKVKRGRCQRTLPKTQGVLHHAAKVDEDEDAVREIRAAAGKFGEGRRLAAKYGLAPSTVTHIQQRKLWKHLP